MKHPDLVGKIFFCCLLVVGSLTVAQQSREEKLQQLKNREGIKVTEIEKDIIKIEYPSGKVLYKNISDYQSPITDNLKYSPTYDSTIIDLRYIDTTLYYHKYSFWQEVPIHNWDFDYLRIGDVNNNGKPELYGSRKFFQTDFEPITVYELNDAESFDPIYQYDSVFMARNIYDVDRDGKDEVLLTLPPLFGDLPNQQRSFSKENDASLATELNFIFAPFEFNQSQLNDIVLDNIDGDQFTDILFIKSGYPDVHIFEYNPVINNFDSVYRFDVPEPQAWANSGFSVSDFDLDGKKDMVFGTVRGNVFVLENEGDNQYANSWQGSVESYNAYIHTWTNDIDGNGKPEFWVLADAFFSGTGVTRITIFETNGNNNYQIVGRVDLVGVFSFYAGTTQAVDIDKDGIEEVAICIDGNFLILKFNGSENHHTYEVYYIKQNEIAASGGNSVYFGATVYDLLMSGEINLLISMDEIVQQGGNSLGRRFTQIYKPDSTTGVDNEETIPDKIILYQNYPNPFNPSTNIKFELNKSENVYIKVYNILGKEIKLLLLEEYLP
ncbi:MAG: FG-GAP-like repeat-containing protein, partial [Ignavibacteria bacterium]|nr:FG-GAP-like repeat-containing protein [Ignavibacteria bacterium]